MKSRIRQDAIVRSLRRSATSSIEALCVEVGASRSTIIRDLSALRDEGYVIHAEQGRGGGLYLDPSSVQTRAQLSVPEVFALIISVASMRAAAMLPFSSLADAGLAKIEKALPPDKLRDLRRLLECLYVGPLAAAVDTSGVQEMVPDLLPAFEQAFLCRQCLRFQYSDAKGVKTERQVEPQAMLILPPLWYLVAWDPLRQDFRHFRMDRISQPVAVEGAPFRSRHVTFDDGVEPVRYA
ncbi:putative DNA-binding transcriptional regulator YafY [Loktanella sp. PT4BL]|jgi:predicted DNA-binding transcriptional regulator YafY|uniref:helix-turn-helix transcriptional regulator n=1 Tax=Loktanella sp. PT4BL TaxID=2135611 RepID=UPI000D773A3D|nr:WYL domain-containing protein [Loktanella sp. PT4BL]PXW72800.1 putative DNA-binding transcriptional regulator YafY [Loktanella sp. PT4BL]